MEKIGILGGSFNPVHNGHLAVAQAALRQGFVDRVILLPTGNPPHKHAELADKEDRYEMTRLAAECSPQLEASREEIDREGIIYTVDTMERFRAEHPDWSPVYLIGADTLLILNTWHRYRDLFSLCGFLVLDRPGEGRAEMDEAKARWEAEGAKIEYLTGDPVDISSTEIRRRLAAGEDVSGMLPEAVEEYIRLHGLYGAGISEKDTDEMKREKILYRLKKELDGPRFVHTLGVEETAKKMAFIFGADEEKASLAGLLHDCAKCMPLSQMNKAAKRENPDEIMKESKALLHSVAGMCIAREVYGVQDAEVLGAIRWHTTGHADMTKLEKIVYLADMIEPNRKPYPGLEHLRVLCMKDLDEAMHEALRMSLEHVQEQGKPLHPDTMAALRMYEDVPAE